MKPLNVWAVCKDPNGTNGILPVVDELRRREHTVIVITNGWAATQSNIEGTRIEDDNFGEAYALFQSDKPDLLLTSTCSMGGTGMYLIMYLRDSCPTVALQDTWAGALTAEHWQNPDYHPDHILTPDRIGRDVMLRCWPDFDAERIHPVGFPAMDHYAEFDVPAVRTRVRTEHALSADRPILLFLGGGTATGNILQAVVQALNEVGELVQLIVRAHPRMETDFPLDAHAWNVACDSFRSGTLIRQGPKDIDDAIAASDIVLGAASSAQITAAIMGVPSISVMFPHLGERVYREGYRGLLDEFPLDTMGISSKASDARGLEQLLREHFRNIGKPTTMPQGVEWLPVGHAAARAADALEHIAASWHP